MDRTYLEKQTFICSGKTEWLGKCNTSKTEWLGKFDPIMGQVLLKWDSTVIYCGDMSIAIIKVNIPVYRLSRDILKEHGLIQQVTQLIRNNH